MSDTKLKPATKKPATRKAAPHVPELTKDDVYLFGIGTWERSWEKMGAHPDTQNRTRGWRFCVWAPDVKSVHVIGEFNDWNEQANPLVPVHTSAIWEGFIPGAEQGQLYKYLIETNEGEKLYKADPYAFKAECPPGTASVLWTLDGYQWNDAAWLKRRAGHNHMSQPLNIYEVHIGSWKRHGDAPQGEPDEYGNYPGPMDPFPAQRGEFYTYDDLSVELVDYVRDMGYTHIEVMPLMEHPFDGSWGYQTTGYYAATSRYGNPQQLMHFIDACHEAGIGVIMDWVPGGFCADSHGLATFNGHMLFEHEIHPNWGTHKFDFARGEVRSFLVSNVLYWLENFHVDGIRMDGVSSMLYLNFGIDDPGQKKFNKYGTEEDLDASAFIRQVNCAVEAHYPDVMMMAEESTAWPLVTYRRRTAAWVPLQVGHGLDERHPALHADRFSVAPRQPRPAHVLHHVCLYRELYLSAEPRRGRARQVLAYRPHAGRLVAPVCRPAHTRLLPDDAPRCQAQLYGQRDRPVY
ncbi:MAG: alpha-amylase family glycosyl hydrolase [Collinsella sp.]